MLWELSDICVNSSAIHRSPSKSASLLYPNASLGRHFPTVNVNGVRQPARPTHGCTIPHSDVITNTTRLMHKLLFNRTGIRYVESWEASRDGENSCPRALPVIVMPITYHVDVFVSAPRACDNHREMCARSSRSPIFTSSVSLFTHSNETYRCRERLHTRPTVRWKPITTASGGCSGGSTAIERLRCQCGH